jgi:hypothetical protein
MRGAAADRSARGSPLDQLLRGGHAGRGVTAA